MWSSGRVGGGPKTVEALVGPHTVNGALWFFNSRVDPLWPRSHNGVGRSLAKTWRHDSSPKTFRDMLTEM
jgi:hypothetical protein